MESRAPGAAGPPDIALRLLTADELLHLAVPCLEGLQTRVSEVPTLRYEGTHNLVPPSVRTQYLKRIGKTLEVLRAPTLGEYTYDQLLALSHSDLLAVQAQLLLPTQRFRCATRPCLWRSHRLRSLRTRVDLTVRLYHAHCVEWKSTEDLILHHSSAELEQLKSRLAEPGVLFYVRGEVRPRELSSGDVAILLERVQRACLLRRDMELGRTRILDRLDYTVEELKRMSVCALFRLRVAARTWQCLPKDCFDDSHLGKRFPSSWATDHQALRHNIQTVIDTKYPNVPYRKAVCLQCRTGTMSCGALRICKFRMKCIT